MNPTMRSLLQLTVDKYPSVDEFPENLGIMFDAVKYECAEKCGHDHVALRIRVMAIPPEEFSKEPDAGKPRSITGNETVVATACIASCNLESLHRHVSEVISECLHLDAAVYRLAMANQKNL
jgi:hypothetical protein